MDRVENSDRIEDDPSADIVESESAADRSGLAATTDLSGADAAGEMVVNSVKEELPEDSGAVLPEPEVLPAADGVQAEAETGAGKVSEIACPEREDALLAESAIVSEENSPGDDPEVPELEDNGFELPLVQVVEAILFAADEAVGIEKIAKSAGQRIRREAVAEAISELQAEYRESDRAFEIVEIAEKFQMLTRPEFAGNVQALYGKRAVKEEKDKKLSPAALDTLAIIAYKQPVTRAEVEAVRGVGCGQVMRQLMERGSIKPVGKKMDVIGYPLLYGTTEFFLQEFGLASLEVLPMAAELRRLTKIELPVPEVVSSAAGAEQESELPEDSGTVEKTEVGMQPAVSENTGASVREEPSADSGAPAVVPDDSDSEVREDA